MILLFVLISAVASFVSWMLIKRAFPRWFFGLFFTLLLLASVILMTLNMSRHFGMTRAVSVQRQEIYSVAGNRLAAGVLATAKNKKLGSQLDVYLYKKRLNAKGTEMSVPALYRSISLQETNTRHAYRITRSYRWRYENNWYRQLFAIGHLDRMTSHEEVRFQIPQRQWIQLTSEQLNRLEKLMADPAKIANPKVSLLVSASAQALQQGQPGRAAETQVAAIRELLSIAPSSADQKIEKQLSSSVSASLNAQSLASSSSAAAQAAQAASVSASIAAGAAAQSAAAQSQADQQAADTSASDSSAVSSSSSSQQ